MIKALSLRGIEFFFPDFFHEFRDSNHENPDPSEHTFRGSFVRHRAVEGVLDPVRHIFFVNDRVPFFNIFDALLGILYGLNCGFPLRDIGRHLVWDLRGGILPFKETT